MPLTPALFKGQLHAIISYSYLIASVTKKTNLYDINWVGKSQSFKSGGVSFWVSVQSAGQLIYVWEFLAHGGGIMPERRGKEGEKIHKGRRK